MEAISLVKELYVLVRYLQEVHEVAEKMKDETAEMLGRLLAIAPHLDSIEEDLQRGRFKEEGALLTLRRLHSVVAAAEQLVSKLSGTKRGGVIVAWAKGTWNAKSNMEQLRNMATRLDSAVGDLTFSAVRHGFEQQVSRALEGFWV
ncbi:hypothetical protein T484DRAFT_1793585 [Baffinella frigidus]|nr:hypothetical protein T484DRAFT_1793585 [Cryptophyta sp. CCMP2293]